MCKSLNRRGCGDGAGSGRRTGQDLQENREWRAWRQADPLGQPGSVTMGPRVGWRDGLGKRLQNTHNET